MAVFNDWSERIIVYSVAISALSVSWMAIVSVTDFKDEQAQKSRERKENFIREYGGEEVSENNETNETQEENENSVPNENNVENQSDLPTFDSGVGYDEDVEESKENNDNVYNFSVISSKPIVDFGVVGSERIIALK